uniref:Uncharacterized protein n=1 Tax=Scleropages formosus TaxID=113540 RepID=A0A8C9SZU0_SCLFO
MPALLDRPQLSNAMARALHQCIVRDRERRRQGTQRGTEEEQVDKMMEEKMRKEEESKRKKEMEERMSLEETKEQVSGRLFPPALKAGWSLQRLAWTRCPGRLLCTVRLCVGAHQERSSLSLSLSLSVIHLLSDLQDGREAGRSTRGETPAFPPDQESAPRGEETSKGAKITSF